VTRLGFVLAMAVRESRAARRRLLLLTASVTVGVAALVALNSFTANMRTAVAEQAQSLLGADLAVRLRSPFSARAIGVIDSAAGCSGTPCPAVAQVTGFSAMAYVPRTEGTRLVQVAAIEGNYPFYGRIRTAPESAWNGLASGRHVIVDPTLLAALSARVGDSLALGDTRFAITGTIVDVPGDVGVRSAFGPRIFIAGQYLAETHLLVTGSRAEYERFIKLPGGDPQAIAGQLRSTLSAERVTVRTVSDDERDLDETLDQLGRYLGLVALIALLLGGLGVASAVHVFIRRKIDTIAILRCLGATSSQVLSVYLLQAAAMGLLGSACGALLGMVLQLGLPYLFADFLPVDVAFAISWPAILLGIGTGLIVASMFALLPLLGIRRISPLMVLRREFETIQKRPRDWRKLPAYAAMVLCVAGLAALQVGNLVSGALFTLAIGVVLGVLALAALILIKALRRWFPSRLPYLVRQGLANLYRPANQTVVVMLSLGFGAFLLSTLYLVQSNLLRDFRFGNAGPRPNLVLFDIQPDQRGVIDNILAAAGHERQPAVPIIPMRILSVKGRPVSRILADSVLLGEDGQQLGRWAFRREYRSTYRDTVVGSEKVLVGDWWKPGVSGSGTIPISVEVEVAGELGITIGDTLVWDVQGLPVTTRVVNLREVNWARMEPNFFVVFPDGPLNAAPQMFVVLSRIPDPAARGTVQRQVVERFPNVTSLDLTQIQASIENLIDKVVLVIRFMALFSLATGAVVLVGAVATSRFQRIREGVLLKTLGATRKQILQILLVEYLFLGTLAVALALLLSTGAGWLLMKYVFESDFAIPFDSLTMLAAGMLALTVAVGLLNSTEIFRKTPLEVLRAE
jgi:putative ABC transport system permease protein